MLLATQDASTPLDGALDPDRSAADERSVREVEAYGDRSGIVHCVQIHLNVPMAHAGRRSDETSGTPAPQVILVVSHSVVVSQPVSAGGCR